MTDTEAQVWLELFRRLRASGKPVSRALISKTLGEMEAEQTERHRREMARLQRELRLTNWKLAGMVCLLIALVVCGVISLWTAFGR